MFSFFSDTDFKLSLKDRKIVVPVLEKIFSDYDKEINYVNIIFLNDEQLLKINKDYLQHDYYTDIITFPYSNENDPVEAELYVSIDRIRENAIVNNVDFKIELNRVLIHGVLHLVGYGDSTNDLRQVMQSIENKYINIISST